MTDINPVAAATDMPAPTVSTLSGPPEAHDPHAHSILAHHFDDLEQQKEAGTLGMWAFLATEIMFFGALMTCYAVYRSMYAEGFAAGSNHENLWIGCINTCVLLVSSFTVVLAVHAAENGDNRGIIRYLWITIVLGALFVAIKGYEWTHLFHESLVPGANFDAEGLIAPHLRPSAEMFFSFYFIMTGIHALHMIVGIGIVLWIISLARRRRFSREYYNPVEIGGLYWHFVDIVWIFLYPLLYLVDPLLKK
jgi:cytochrome c oxidase subunit 3